MITLTNPLSREKFDGSTVVYDQFEVIDIFLVWKDVNNDKYIKFSAELTASADASAKAINVKGRILYPAEGTKSVIETNYDLDATVLSVAQQNIVKGWVDDMKDTIENGLNSIAQVPGTIS